MSDLSNVGSTHIAKLLFDDTTAWFIAIGEGDEAWDDLATVPEPAQTATGLVAHIGHFVATAQYVTPAVNGAITTSASEKWDVSVAATRYIHLSAPIDYADAVGETIRELAVYVDATPDTGHEAQTYLPVADLAGLGTLLNQGRRSPVVRTIEDNGTLSLVFFVGEA